MAQDGLLHKELGITFDNTNGEVGVKDLTTAAKGKKLDATEIQTNMETVTQKLANVADNKANKDDFKTLKDLNNIDNTTIKNTAKSKLAEETASATEKALGKAASSSVSSLKSVTKSVAKEAFSGWGIAITAITGLTSELPSIVTAFKQSSNEGWSQLGKSVATIAISDIGLSAAGQILCGTLGFTLGGLLGPVGASIGGAIGKAIGSSLGSVIGRKLSSWIFGKSTTEKQAEEQIKEQAQTVASSQVDLQTLLSQAKAQAAAETDSNKAKKILAQVQAIENKLNTSTLTASTQNTAINPFVSA